MAFIKQLTGFNETSNQQEDIYPVTVSDAVINPTSGNSITKEFSELEQEQKQGVIYDVSAHNDGATFASLSALLSSNSLSTLIPTSVRHGGMTIRFVQSSDNKYVQYRLMAAAWSTITADWQGIDDEPTAYSDNIVKSGGVYDEMYGDETILETIQKSDSSLSVNNNSYINSIGNIVENEDYKIYYRINGNGYIYFTPDTYIGRKIITLGIYNGTVSSTNLVSIFSKELSDIDLPGTLPTADNKYYIQNGMTMAVSIHNNYDFHIVYETRVRNKKVYEKIKDLQYKVENIPVVEIGIGYNRFNSANIVNSYIATNGLDVYDDNSISTIYISIPDGETKLVLNNFPTYTSEYNRICAFYNANKDFISRTSIKSSETQRDFDIPSNAKYMRVSIFVLYEGEKSFDNIFIGFNSAHKNNTYREYLSSMNGLKEKLPTFDKTLVIFGDSRVETASVNDDGTNYVEGTKRNYPMYLPELLQLGEMKNFALSGAAYRYRGDHYAYRQEISNQILCAIANGVKPDIVIIDAGTNDANASLPVHSSMTYDQTMALSFSQLSLSEWLNAVRWAYEKVKTTWKDAICFAVTPTQRADMWTDENVKSGLRPVVCKGIKEMAQTFDFIVLDSFAQSNICYVNEVWERNGTYLRDGLHPNEDGMKRLANYISASILSHYKNE